MPLVPAFSPRDHWRQRLGEGHLAGWALCPGQNLRRKCRGPRRPIPWSAWCGREGSVCLTADPLHCPGARRGVAPRGLLAPSQDRVSSGLAEPPSPLWKGTVRGRKGQMSQKEKICPQQRPWAEGLDKREPVGPKGACAKAWWGGPGRGGLGRRVQSPRQRQEGQVSSKLPACALFRGSRLV